ncbi:hypothetical protein GEM_0088 [Burkholderia cepacia GG4]|uniref:Uncharacterized protein n=1 Tax=Burkholderia cepacia GG4 TaxID=1009846 RepID=A0A9W3JXF3_BURCE|nr:hypothetical protein GEM_0088 [Burkholderia cepacia GG4]
MYGPNYSGFAFHPKTVRMVGSVHFADFFRSSGQSVPSAPLLRRRLDLNTHQLGVQNRGSGSGPVKRTSHPVTVFPINRAPLIHCAVRLAMAEPWRAPNTHQPVQPHCPEHPIRRPSQGFHLFLRHLSPTRFTHALPCPRKQKRRVSRETRRSFHVTRPAIKPFSSPAPGMSQSHADSAPVRPPALRARTHPSPAHNRSRRSAARPEHSARSAASRRRCRATR